MKKNSSFFILHSSFSNGFTLVELLVSIAIVGLMSAAALVNFRSGARSDALRLGAREVVSRIRDAQTMAATGRSLAELGRFEEANDEALHLLDAHPSWAREHSVEMIRRTWPQP